MLDVVTREVVVSASADAVWTALTVPDQVAQWFGDTAEIDLRLGGSVRFTWPAGEISTGVIVTLDPLRMFAFRWDVFGTIDDPTLFTVVEFAIRESEAGVLVSVTERGLHTLVEAGVAPELDDLLEEHIDGWRNEMSDLARYLGQSTARTGLDASAPSAHS